MDKQKEIKEMANQNPYEGIDEKLVNFTKAIEFYGDYGKHPFLCTENCKECKFQPLCEYRGEINVNLALHLMDAGYGNVKQAVKEFAEEVKKLYPLPIRNDKELERYMQYKQAIDSLFKQLYGED